MPSRAPSTAQDHAIVIGIDRYEDDRLERLTGARADAKAFHDWLIHSEGGGVPRHQATLVTQRGARSREATFERLRRAFEKLSRRARRRATIGRRLYLYFAGHGIAQHRDEASLLASDGGLETLEKHIPSWKYACWFIHAAYFEQVVVFVDCCRTSQHQVAVQAFPLDDIDGQAGGEVGYVKGFAVKFGQSALELRTRKGVGVFTAALLDALKHAYQGEEVTARSVADYLHNHPELRKVRDQQEPSFVSEGDVVFARRPPGREAPTIRVRLHLSSGILPTVEGGPGGASWGVRPARGGFVTDLPVGIYAVKVSGRTEHFFEVSGASGKELHVPARG
jgi:uncharacterized caspase-like protein